MPRLTLIHFGFSSLEPNLLLFLRGVKRAGLGLGETARSAALSLAYTG